MSRAALGVTLLFGVALTLSASCSERDRTLLAERNELEPESNGTGNGAQSSSESPLQNTAGGTASDSAPQESRAADVGPPAVGEPQPVHDTSVDGGAAPVLPPAPLYPANWCDRAGEDALYQEDTAYEIIELFLLDSRMAELPPSFDLPEFDVWFEYLREYTNALLGCPPLYVESFDVTQQGFGLRNTSVAGVPEQRFDAALAAEVIDAYVQAVRAMIALSTAEADAFWLHLWELAQRDACFSESAVRLPCGSADAGAP